MSTDHDFDRRSTDVNVAALAVRVDGLERRMENVEMQQVANNRELVANTTLTKQVHSMVEETIKNTADIVDAVKWLGTSKKVIAVIAAAVGGAAGLVVAVASAAKAVGIM